MSKEFIKNFGGYRKYFLIFFFILILIFISAIIKPIITDYIKDNWSRQQENEIENIEASVKKLYKRYENHLLQVSYDLKNNLADTLKSGKNSFGSLVQLVNADRYKNYSIEIVAPNGKLIAWNENIAIPQYDIFPLNFPAGEVYFYNSSLETYLSFTDTVSIQSDIFYFVISRPFEKRYSLQNTYYRNVNFSNTLSDKFLTVFNINYSSSTPLQNSYNSYSFELLNNKGDGIAAVSFIKPLLSSSINSIINSIGQVQSLLIIAALIFLAVGFKGDFNRIKQRWLKFIIIIFYCALFRVIIFFTGFPSNIISGPLTDPSYFSSAFGGGIVRSPMEFFVTALFLLIIGLQAFRYMSAYIQHPFLRKKKKKFFIFFIVLIPVSILFFLMLRGLTAALRSVIFDSTLRYFKELNLIPDLPTFVMNLNILMLGLTSVIFVCCFLFFLIPFFYSPNKKLLIVRYLFIFIFFQIAGYVFIVVQKQPLITPVLSAIFVALIFSIVYYTAFIKTGSVYNFIYLTLTASLITITLLNFFNLELEKESLKTTALEINRPNDNLFRFLLNETLTNINGNDRISEAFSNTNINYDALAFIVWANSALQRESVNSSVDILNSSGELLGSFSAGMDISAYENIYSGIPFDTLKSTTRPFITKYINQYGEDRNLLVGIIPFTLDSIRIGYLTAAVELSEEDYINNNIPEFLGSQRNYLNNVIDINQLKIFKFSDNKLTKVFGDIYPSNEETRPILNEKFKKSSDAWLKLVLSGETYFAYALSTENNGTSNITVVALREKDISWNLFNFFKIFILHSIIIITLFFILFIVNIKEFKYSFRIQLLIAFLSISILPVIILAIYNRKVVDERTESAIFEVLDKRSDYIVNQVRYQLKKDPQLSYTDAFYNSSKESGISFSVYEFTNQVFSSKYQYYNSGLFDSRLNTQAYYNLYYLSYQEYLTKEKIENYTYNSFYKKVNIEGNDFIIGVNDAFNKVRLVFSTVDIDVFLFGIYSFAAIVIIILSTILANRISSPIRRLTKATDSVAHGDLNVELQNNEKGEMKDLFQGFNTMTRELRKNQIEISEMERESAWKEMAKQVAHEIKNPLTPMKLAVQQLIISYKDRNQLNNQPGKNFDSIFEKVSSTILNQIENLSLIASEFSRFAKMPSLRLERLDLLKVINESINLFVEEKIQINLETGLSSAMIDADKTQLRRLFINLVRNSIQASSSIINIIVKEEENCYKILVRDNGKGIPEESKEKIFNPDFTTKEKGMGIGLKLARRFLEGINGGINLLESSSSGTTFQIIIPKSDRT